MGEDKANTNQHRRLLLRLEWPNDTVMAVEVDLEQQFLERVWKLMLICEKIQRTMHGKAKVVIDNACCQYVTIHSEPPIRWLLSMAKVDAWCQLQCLWIPNDLLLGRLGQCRVMAGMRENRTIVDQDAVWFEESDGNRDQFVSVRLGRDWLIQTLQSTFNRSQR
jgi:hypothetical protein